MALLSETSLPADQALAGLKKECKNLAKANVEVNEQSKAFNGVVAKHEWPRAAFETLFFLRAFLMSVFLLFFPLVVYNGREYSGFRSKGTGKRR